MSTENVCHLITTAESVASDEFQVHLADLERAGRLRVWSIGRNQNSLWRLMRRAAVVVDHLDVQRLILPNSDKLLLPMCAYLLRERARGRSTSVRMLLLRTPEIALRLKRSAVIALLKSVLARLVVICGRDVRCFFLTDAFGVVKSRRGYGMAQPAKDVSPGLVFMSKTNARQHLGIDSRSFVIGILGDLSHRKFPELSIKALALLPHCVELLAAGRMDDETRNAIRDYQVAGGTRIHAEDGYLTNDLLARCICSCDALILTYETDGPSGMLISAFEAGVPVIAAGSAWLNCIVESEHLGVVADLSASGLASAVKSMISEAYVVRPRGEFVAEMPSLVHALTK